MSENLYGVHAPVVASVERALEAFAEAEAELERLTRSMDTQAPGHGRAPRDGGAFLLATTLTETLAMQVRVGVELHRAIAVFAVEQAKRQAYSDAPWPESLDGRPDSPDMLDHLRRRSERLADERRMRPEDRDRAGEIEVEQRFPDDLTMQWPEPVALPHLRSSAPPVARCSGCGRKSWAFGDRGRPCRVTQPDESVCMGVLEPIVPPG